MFFLNLTAGEFFTLLLALGGFVAALYFLDRTKRKKIVSTLRFWTPALTAEERQSRKRVREPWSLVLQLLGLLLLLLAIAQLQWGRREHRDRDHVLLLDTSSWTAENIRGATLLDREKALARRYLAALPSRDRVMLVRVDSLATPVTPFTTDRAQVARELTASTSGFSALNIEQALLFAQQAQTWSGQERGEIVYIGPGLISGGAGPAPKVPNLRLVTVAANREHCGIRRVGVKRTEQGGDGWQAIVAVKNYGSKPQTVHLKVRFAGTQLSPRVLALGPGEERDSEYSFVSNVSGRLVVEIEPRGGLTSDDRAMLELPVNRSLRVAVFTARPDLIRPLFEANRRVDARYFTPSEYAAHPQADVMVLDQMAPAQLPELPSVWIDPPPNGSPIPVESVVSDAVIENWRAETVLGAGLHAREAPLSAAEVFQTAEGDIPVGSVAQGPVVVARSSSGSRPKLAVVGFDPSNGQIRFEVTTPLLFANLLRWLSPEPFRAVDISVGRVGTAAASLEPAEHPDHIRVMTDDGSAVPFTIRSRSVQLFTSRPAVVRILSDEHERVLSLTLPEIADRQWKPPRDAAVGLPLLDRFTPWAVDLWRWLAILGGLVLFVEWRLFGRNQAMRWQRRRPVPNKPQVPEREEAPLLR